MSTSNLATLLDPLPQPEFFLILQEGDPRLRLVSKSVLAFGELIKSFARDMLATMYHHNGIGLSAPQVGSLLRIIVLDVSPRRSDPMILVNPVITKRRHRMLSREGCLSVDRAKWNSPIERSKLIDVDYCHPDGAPDGLRARGLLAACIQHEIDHLDGRLITDYSKPWETP